MDNKELINIINEQALECMDDLSQSMCMAENEQNVRYLYAFNDGVNSLRKSINSILRQQAGGKNGESQKSEGNESILHT